MTTNQQYQPLLWPPDLKIAEVHYKCNKPGIDNPEGYTCSCCDRYQKLENTKWITRDIMKDFKNYGGGVAAYFNLMIYLGVILVFLCLLKVVYHIYLIQLVCPTLEGKPDRCMLVFNVFRFCSTAILNNQLVNYMDKAIFADVLQYLQLATYIVLIAATIGIKIYLQHLNADKIMLDEKLFSRFSLIIKNVPLYYQLEDLKKQLAEICPNVQICQIFYVHKANDYDHSYRECFELYFELKWAENEVEVNGNNKNIKQLRQKYEKYIKSYQDLMMFKENLTKHTKKIIVVFNTIQQKQTIYNTLKVNDFKIFTHYLSRAVGCDTDPIKYYAQKLVEPQEVNWKYLGESSTMKTKVRVETTVIGIGFMLISFAIFYFPTIKADEQKVYDPSMGTVLGFIISVLIIVLANIYRVIIVKLTPSRKASSKMAQAYFLVMTTIVFHYFFYLVTPATFYIIAIQIKPNIKLKELFMAVMTFTFMTVIIALLDLRYRFFKSKKGKLISQSSVANHFCQQKLHEELNPPSFPIEFKMMVVFNIWTFNSYYIFEIPYLLIAFMLVYLILYWVDKYILYKHYKMQSYLSIELELKVQKIYIILFLICVSLGYFLSTNTQWERYTIIGVIVAALIINFSLNFTYKKHKDEILKRNTDLKTAINFSKMQAGASFHMNLIEKQFKSSFLLSSVPDFSSESLGSSVFNYGYQQVYTRYLNQFKNKEINEMLQQKYNSIKHSKNLLDEKEVKAKRKQSEMVGLGEDKNLDQKLIDNKAESQEAISIRIVKPIEYQSAYEPPTVVSAVQKKQSEIQLDESVDKIQLDESVDKQ